MIRSTLCFFTGTTGLLRSYQNDREPQTKWTDLRGPHTRKRALCRGAESNCDTWFFSRLCRVLSDSHRNLNPTSNGLSGRALVRRLCLAP